MSEHAVPPAFAGEARAPADGALRHPSAVMIAAGAAGAVVVGAGAALGPAAGAAALAAVALAVVVLWRPDVGALVLVGVAPAVSGLGRGVPIPGLRLSELLIAGVSVLVLVRAGARRVPWHAFDWLALAYVVATAGLGAFDLLERGAPFTATSVGTLIGPLQFLLLYRAVLTALPTPDQRRVALRLIVLASVPVSVLAVLQQFDVGPARDLVTTLTGTDIYATTVQNAFGFEVATARATGPFPHWHDLGGYLMVVLLLGFGLLVEGSGRVLPRWALVAIMAPAAVALVQTASAAPILATCAGVVIVGVWVGRRRSMLAWTLAGAVVVALAFSPLLQSRIDQQFEAPPGTQASLVPQTLAYRYAVWEQFVPVLEGRLVTGYGPDVPAGLSFPHAESLYVELVLRGGLPLLAIYGALMWSLAAVGRRTAREPDPEARVVGRVVTTVVVLLVVIHFVETYFIDSGVPHVLWALAALLVHDRPPPSAARPWRAAGTPPARPRA